METTDINLFVRTSEETISDWNREKIVSALIRETLIDDKTAQEISEEVEQTIRKAGVKMVTAPLIREIVNAKLIERGLETARKMHTRLGMPIYDVDSLILHPNKENANVPHGPEATNLTLAERIKKEYALLAVFSQDVADAHMNGDIHIHDLGFIDRPYCSGQSLEYIKRFGLNLPHSLSMAKPAKHPEVLLAHLIKFAAALQSNFAGAIGWDAVNIFFAPYLEGMSDEDVKQLAQMLIF
ncbi:MAG TPA: anaerobic ribonucleoside-triphosphate reductase, partial [Syntrophorhabdaceae bacterium]|nr:anaerobic ribonucleoside-triphosphate reductase [Syntrophorhabdaceae bacterium]